jgi:uncharacterized protein (TIGR02265 family)
MSHEAGGEDGSAYDVEQDIAQRLSLVTPQHTTRGFLFALTLKKLRALGVDEAEVQRCLAVSGEAEFVEFFSYPTGALLRLISAAARVLSARCGSFEEGLRQIGMGVGEGYRATAVGRSAHLMAGGDPKQFMGTLQALYAVTSKYAQPSVVWKGPKRGVLALQSTFVPPLCHEGAVKAIARELGLGRVEVRVRRTGALGIELEVSWE